MFVLIGEKPNGDTAEILTHPDLRTPLFDKVDMIQEKNTDGFATLNIYKKETRFGEKYEKLLFTYKL